MEGFISAGCLSPPRKQTARVAYYKSAWGRLKPEFESLLKEKGISADDDSVMKQRNEFMNARWEMEPKLFKDQIHELIETEYTVALDTWGKQKESIKGRKMEDGERYVINHFRSSLY